MEKVIIENMDGVLICEVPINAVLENEVINKIAKKYQDYSSHTTYNQHAKSLDYSISMLFSRLLLTHQVSKMGLYY